jgi:hypothetical protein
MNYYPHQPGDIEANCKLHKLPMVYVLEANSFQYIKIGYAKSFKQRLFNIQNGCPFKLTLWLGIFTPRFVEIEKFLHTKFKHCRLRGEWFTPSNDDLDELMDFFKNTNMHIRGMQNA